MAHETIKTRRKSKYKDGKVLTPSVESNLNTAGEESRPPLLPAKRYKITMVHGGTYEGPWGDSYIEEETGRRVFKQRQKFNLKDVKITPLGMPVEQAMAIANFYQFKRTSLVLQNPQTKEPVATTKMTNRFKVQELDLIK